MDAGYIVGVVGPEDSFQNISDLFKKLDKAIDLAKGCQLEVRQVQIRTIADEEEVIAPDLMIGVRCPNRGIYFVDWAASEEEAENSKTDFTIQVRLANVKESSDVMIDCDHHGSMPALEVRITDQIIWPEAEREAEPQVL